MIYTNNMSLKITIRCFSYVRQVLGKKDITLEVSDETDTNDIKEIICEMAGGALDDIPFKIAVNRNYIAESIILKDGDELALIPPVQGGSYK